MYKLLIVILLFLSMAVSGQVSSTDSLFFNGFKQGMVLGGGNCASIALIKASIGRFGVGNVFAYTNDAADSTMLVKLRNDSAFKVTFTELRLAKSKNGFKAKLLSSAANQLRQYADTCFAVMVKMNQLIWEYDTYEESLSALLDGYNTPNVYRLLGVRFVQIPLSEIPSSTHLIFYNSYHAVYSSHGYYDEANSNRGFEKNTAFAGKHFGYKCTLYGCKPRRAFRIE